MTGDGSPDEIEFLNLVVSRIKAQLDRELVDKNSKLVVQALNENFSTYHNGAIGRIADQIDSVIGNVSTAQNDLRIAAGDLQAITTAPITNRSRPPVLARPTDAELQNAIAQKRSLLGQGLTEYHPQVVEVQDQIERYVAARAAKPGSGSKTDSAYVGNTFQTKPNGNSTVVTNKFFTPQGSTPTMTDLPALETSSDDLIADFTAPISRIVNDIEMIDLTPATRELTNLRETLQNTEPVEVVAQRLGDQAIEQLHYSPPIALSNLDMAKRSIPIGGSPTTMQFALLFLFAGVFGALVSWNYDPQLKCRPFRSVDQLQRKLSLPVIGVLRGRNAESSRPFQKVAFFRIVQICEWTLLALAVLLILAALVNSEVAAAFIENPFHGIKKTIWLVSPKH